MLQQLYDKCVKPSIRECKGQTYYGPSVAPNQLDETLRNINEHLGAIDAEQRIQNSEIQTLKCGNFQNVKISDTLKVDNIQSFSNACIRFLDPVNISDLTVEVLHIECFCADDAAKFAGLSCVEWKDIIDNSCVADSNMFAGLNCTQWKDTITDTYINCAKSATCFDGKTCNQWIDIIQGTCVDNAVNATKFANKTYAEVCEDILAHVPPQPYSGEIDVYCGDACLCTINCDNPLVLFPNAFNENAKIDTDTYPGACCVGTVTSVNNIAPVNGNVTLPLPPDLSSCPGLDCIGDVVQSDIQDFITMNDVDECGYTTCVGTVTSVKTCLNGCESNAVTESGTMALNITPSLCFDSNSRKICNILGNKTSNEITLPSGINCVGTVVQSDIEDFITMSEVDACGYTTCLGTVTSVNNITPVNGNVTLALPPDLSSDVTCLRNDVDAIEGKIPTQASTTNQLADKDFVNSSIETATATFVGTFDDVSCLPTTGVDNNDYAFVTTCDSQTGTVSYTRYKYSDYTHTWICEYTINTTGFTAEQLAALNSGITDALVAKITDVYNPTVCIYSNGTCCGSFTLNQSSNKCIGICNDKVSQTLLDTSANRPLLFASASVTSGACCGVYYNTNITANANTGVINATLNGLACRAKCNCVITTTCDCTYYPVFSPNNTSSYKYNYTNANLSYNPSTGTLTALCFNGAAKDSTCFAGCTYDCAKADIRNGLTSCVGTVTSVNVCLNGTSATAVTTSGTLSLNITPSLSYTANTRALTTTLGNQTSTAITLPEGINCTGTLVASDLDGYATEVWVEGKNYCTHDCLVKLSFLCSNSDRRILFSAQDNGCVCPVYASNGVPFTYNACCGCLRIGDFTCECCHQLTLRPNSGLIHSGPKGTQNNLGVVYIEKNCLDNCSIGVGIGSGNVNRGIFHYCKATETATSATFQWLQYWDAEKEIHNCPIWGELGDNNKVVYSCTGVVPNNTRRYALICFDKACCGNPSQISACFEVDIYTSKYYIWIDVSNSVAQMRTYWQTNGLDSNCSAYGSFCAALPNTTSNGNCFWITYSNYRAPVIKSARKISIICNTTTAPSGITFTAPTNRNNYVNVYCGTSCVCTLQGQAELCLSANAFNTNASISTTTYPGACCVGTVTSVNACLNGTSATAITSSGTLALDITPSLSLSSDNLTVSLGNKTSSGIDLSGYTNDHKVTYCELCSSEYPLIFSYPGCPADGCSYYVGISGCCKAFFEPFYGQLRVCRVKTGNPKACTSTVTGEKGSYHCAGCSEYYANTPFIDFHHNNACDDYSVRIINNAAGSLEFIVANGTGCTHQTASSNFCFCSNGYFYGNVCGSTTKFNGCTYSQACTDIRSGLVTTTDLNSCGYTTCTGTVTSVNACLNGTSATAITSSGTLALDITPSIALTDNNLTVSLGDKTSDSISLADYTNDHKVTYTAHSSSTKYPLIFSNVAAPTSGSTNNVGYSSGCIGYYQPSNGTLWTCVLRTLNPTACTADVAGIAGIIHTAGYSDYYRATPYIDFHHNYSCADYSARIINTCAGRFDIIVNNATGCTASTASKTFCFCSNGYFYGNVCGNLCGNAACFGGNTYAQACANIRTGLVTTTDLNSCGYTTCTGTLVESDIADMATQTWVTNQGYTTCTGNVSSISLNGNAFTVSNGAATLTGFKPDTAVLADCAATIKRTQIKVNAGYPLALLGATTAIDNANIYVSCYCQATFNSCNGVLLSPILCATSYVRTPTINANSASGVSKVCNVVIRACCTNAECTVCCRNFTFCGSTGRMHGDVCGTLYGNAYNSCLVCRYTINTGVQHVLLGANCTASANTCVRVSNGCPLTFDPATGTLCTCEVIANNFIPTPTCPATGICYIDFNGFMRSYKIASAAKACDVFCSLCDFFDFYTSKGVNGTIGGQYIDNIYNYNGSIAFRAINTDFLVVSNSNTNEVGCNINFIISL